MKPRNKSIYWVMLKKDAVSEQARLELETEFARRGLSPQPPQRGGVGDVVHDVTILLLSINEPWRSIFLGVLANRIDKLIDISLKWFRKQQLSKDKKHNYVIELYVYRKPLFRGAKTGRIKVSLQRPISKKELLKLLKAI